MPFIRTDVEVLLIVFCVCRVTLAKSLTDEDITCSIEDSYQVWTEDAENVVVTVPWNGTQSTRDLQNLYSFNRSDFLDCNVSEGVLISTSIDGSNISLHQYHLKPGRHYFAVFSGDEQNATNSFRLDVTVKSHACSVNSSDGMKCSNHGHCTTNSSQENYTCLCCNSFHGELCEMKKCLQNMCMNGATCIPQPDGQFHCACADGYNGVLCETVQDPCREVICENNGTCIYKDNLGICACPAGYTGEKCEHKIDSCKSSPCRNGICENVGNGYQCYCVPGYCGVNCDTEYNECQSFPCQNGATCLNRIDKYICKCGRGYSGITCETKIDLCHKTACRHGGTCIDNGNSISCRCKHGYTGKRCEVDINECDSNPCHHGGTCRDLPNGYHCICSDMHAGINCNYIVDVFAPPMEGEPMDNQSVHSERHLHNLYIVAGTLSGAVFIVIIVMASCYCKIHESYKYVFCRRFLYDAHMNEPSRSLLEVHSVNPLSSMMENSWENSGVIYHSGGTPSPAHESLLPKTFECPKEN